MTTQVIMAMLLASMSLVEQGFLNPTEKQFAEFLEAHKQENPGKPLAKRSLEELREGTSVLLQYAGDAAEISYHDEEIPTSIRIYNDHLPEGSPVLIFFPGCAFVFDLFEINHIICSRIALHSNIKVILVNFRLAPENPLPTSILDSYDATLYIAEHFEQFGIDPNRIFLGGWCSGAHVAAAISNLNPPFKIFHQILLSGRYDLTESNHTYDSQEKEDKTVSRELLRHITETYYGLSEADARNPIFSPYFTTNFHNFPSTTILCGEFDALRNDSEGYFSKLKESGVEVEKILLPGQTHNTIMMRKVLSDGPDPAEVIARLIRARISQR